MDYYKKYVLLEEIMEKYEYYTRLLEEYFVRCRHIEDQREKAQAFIITISLFIISLILKEKNEIFSLILSICLILIGILGCKLSKKYKERFDFQRSRARTIRKFLEEKFFLYGYKESVIQSDYLHKRKDEKLYEKRLYKLWLRINDFIIIVGIILLLYSLDKVYSIIKIF